MPFLLEKKKRGGGGGGGDTKIASYLWTYIFLFLQKSIQKDILSNKSQYSVW